MSQITMMQVMGTLIMLALFIAVVVPDFKYKGLLLVNVAIPAILLFLYSPLTKLEPEVAIVVTCIYLSIGLLLYLVIAFMIDQDIPETIKNPKVKIATTILTITATVLIFKLF
jgi:hypothetical protein